MLRSLLCVLAGVFVLAVVIGLGGIFFRGKEYTIEELYAETKANSVKPAPLNLVELVMHNGGERTAITDFLELVKSDPDSFEPAINRIRSNWHPGDTVMLVEIEPYLGDYYRRYVVRTIDEAIGEKLGDRQEAQYEWVWNQDDDLHPQYLEFKESIYSRIDERFATFFSMEHKSLIPFSEVRWGGVNLDGIPPLQNPATVTASDAAYLDADDVVFGVEVGGEARAYPKKVLAWHEMVNDDLGGISICGVYCTLCESMIVYRSKHNGAHHELGTSGFLFRSNKLMYDKETFSMWSTLDGCPVVGPLVDQGIRLDREPVVTTTWAQWRKLHPNTSVLSRRTGFRRDYNEGVAYRDYLATDSLMFTVPRIDTRLKNKAEVFIIDRSNSGDDSIPIAYSVDFLSKNPVYVAASRDAPMVILTDSTGANRAYETHGVMFSRLDGDTNVIDDKGRLWIMTERELVLNDHVDSVRKSLKVDASTDKGSESGESECPRIPAHRSFWFGWYAAHPDTGLIL